VLTRRVWDGVPPEIRHQWSLIGQMWPEWAVLTHDLGKGVPPEIRDQWTLIGSVSGVAYSDRGAKQEVLVLRRAER
jgi:hypothetical protein